MMRYISRPFFLWMGLFLALAAAQEWLARNPSEAMKYLCAAGVAAVLECWFSRKKTARHTLYVFLICTLPALAVIGWAAVKMPQEASAGDYSEIINGLNDSTNKSFHEEIRALTAHYFLDGKLSRWEATELRQRIFESNRWLYRGNAAETQEESRALLRRAIDAPYIDKKKAS
ncbi:TPA: hypothetical protein ACIVGF_002868 [Salmonella enterica subsp. enterica serovar 16:l,v:-]|nr:hypothetical protein [Salmonella enterica]